MDLIFPVVPVTTTAEEEEANESNVRANESLDRANNMRKSSSLNWNEDD